MTQMDSSIDALIVGAGPVGLTMAAELARHGVGCRIIDKCPVATDKSKALVIWSRTLEVLEQMGPIDAFLAAGRLVQGASMYNRGERIVHVALAGLASPYPRPLMLPQCDTERLLTAHLNALGVQIERSVELTDFTPTDRDVVSTLALADGRIERVTSRWLIGCDGAHSKVRHGLGMEFGGDANPNDWVLADVHIDGSISDDEVTGYWHEEGVLVFFPIAPGHYRMIADIGPASSAPRPADPTLDDVQQLLDRRGPGGLVASQPVWLAGFRINERKVDDYRRGRVFLAGDAAHIHSPAGGQGMNTGMQDAFNLAWKIALVNSGQASKSPLLDSYSAERSPVGDLVLRNAGRLTEVATMRNPLAQNVRNHLAKVLTSFDFVQAKAREALSELSIHYPASPLNAERRGAAARGWFVGRGVKPGDRLPDATIVNVRTNARARLFQAIRGTKFNLLLIAGPSDGDTALPELANLGNRIADAHSDLIRSHLIVPQESTPTLESWSGELWQDASGTIAEEHAVRVGTFVLVRPDGYVAFRSQPADGEALAEYLEKTLSAAPAAC